MSKRSEKDSMVSEKLREKYFKKKEEINCAACGYESIKIKVENTYELCEQTVATSAQATSVMVL